MVSIDGENLLNNLRNFNGMFRKHVDYDNIKSHRKARASASIERIHFWKNHTRGQIDPPHQSFKG